MAQSNPLAAGPIQSKAIPHLAGVFNPGLFVAAFGKILKAVVPQLLAAILSGFLVYPKGKAPAGSKLVPAASLTRKVVAALDGQHDSALFGDASRESVKTIAPRLIQFIDANYDLVARPQA